MSESHPDDRPLAAAADPDRSAAQPPGSDSAADDLTQTFAYEFSRESGDDASDPDSEPTVISSGTPLTPLPSWNSLRPRDLGRLLEGRKLDHFHLNEFIGGGGMGAVFRAHDTVLGRTVAVKVLAASATGNEETRLRFQNEAQSAARLDHPNIARVHYVGEAEGFKYIVFEYLEGKNLRDLVAEVGPLPLEDALNFTLQIAEALAHAWQRDIVHRDIKPSNVLATTEGQVKLVDMGLARLRDVATAVEDLTASGVTLGTFDYISPEQARDPRSADIRSDIYSLGCTLYFMLCGRPPFQGGTAIQKLLMHQADEPPSPREYRPDLPPAVEQLLRRMLTKAPSDRFQNPAELIAAIATVADELGIPVHPTTTVQLTVAGQGSSWLGSSLPWLVPTALLLVCVFIIDYLDRSTEVALPWANGGSSFSRAEPRQPVSPSREIPAPNAEDQAVSSAQNRAFGAGNHLPGRSVQSVQPSGDDVDRDAERTNGGNETVEATDEVLLRPTAREGAVSASAGEPLLLSPAWFASALTRIAEGFNEHPVVERVRGTMDHATREESAAAASAEAVIRNVTRRGTYDTLTDAAAAAQDGDVIEIAKNGIVPVHRDTLPIAVKQKQIKVRGAAGTRPVLQVITNAEIGRAGSASNVFEIESGAVRLEGIEVELKPSTPLDVPLTGWKIFELRLGGAVELVRSRLTIRGYVNDDFDMRNHDDFIHVVGRSFFVSPGTAKASDRIRVTLEHVVVRGGDSLVSVDGDADVALKVSNGLIAVRGFLFDGPQRESMDSGSVNLQLDHVTADLGQGALRIRGETLGEDFQADVQDCILLGAPLYALVEHVVRAKPSAQELPLVWRGRRNIYSNWECPFRRQVLDGSGEVWWFDTWKEHWTGHVRGREANSTWGLHPMPWRSSAPGEQPLGGREPADYLLDATSPDVRSLMQVDGMLPGMIVERLPPGSSLRPRLSADDAGSTAASASTAADTSIDADGADRRADGPMSLTD